MNVIGAHFQICNFHSDVTISNFAISWFVQFCNFANFAILCKNSDFVKIPQKCQKTRKCENCTFSAQTCPISPRIIYCLVCPHPPLGVFLTPPIWWWPPHEFWFRGGAEFTICVHTVYTIFVKSLNIDRWVHECCTKCVDVWNDFVEKYFVDESIKCFSIKWFHHQQHLSWLRPACSWNIFYAPC